MTAHKNTPVDLVHIPVNNPAESEFVPVWGLLAWRFVYLGHKRYEVDKDRCVQVNNSSLQNTCQIPVIITRQKVSLPEFVVLVCCVPVTQ